MRRLNSISYKITSFWVSCWAEAFPWTTFVIDSWVDEKKCGILFTFSHFFHWKSSTNHVRWAYAFEAMTRQSQQSHKNHICKVFHPYDFEYASICERKYGKKLYFCWSSWKNFIRTEKNSSHNWKVSMSTTWIHSYSCNLHSLRLFVRILCHNVGIWSGVLRRVCTCGFWGCDGRHNFCRIYCIYVA